MSRKERTEIQKIVIALREKLGMTQLELAMGVGVTPGTVARWETIRPPKGISLLQLAQFARARSVDDLAGLLEQAVRAEGLIPENLRYEPPASYNAVWHLYDNREIPPVGRAYRAVLKSLRHAMAVLIEEAREGENTTESAEYLQDVLGNLEFEEWKYEQDKEADRARQKKKR